MQFHLNGFHACDPCLQPAKEGVHNHELPEAVDVLIAGSGPAGLVLATQLSTFPNIVTRILERRSGPLLMGQADGVACRTVEMFNAFGLADRLLREAYWVNETVFWRPDASHRGSITRTGRVQDTEDGLSEFPHLIVNQARIQDYLLESMEKSSRRLVPDYHWEIVDLARDDTNPYPVQVTLRRTDPGHEGQERQIRARYVVGCDGARSVVRGAIGQQLRGDAANHAWGVMDVLAVTDFPDIRLKAAVQSATGGNLLIIPREGGHLVRFYVDLGIVDQDNRQSIRQTSIEQMVSIARSILHPYTLEVKEVAWSSVYEVGQRLTDRFDDSLDQQGDEREPRVFIAGDACHTHSAKAGQGMNVSMQDTYNLGWKIAAVLEGRSDATLLKTYSQERQPVAQELIDFDKHWAALMGGRPKDPHNPDSSGIDPAEVQEYFVRAGRYTAGVATRYKPGMLTGEGHWQHLAEGLHIGSRFHSAPVIRLADAKPVHLGHTACADGRWTLYAFSDKEQTGLRGLCNFLSEAASPSLRRIAALSADMDGILDVRAIFQQPHRTLRLEDQPPLLLPRKGRYGLIDYEKVFTADSRLDVFALRGIDRERGAMVLVRPDQFIAHVLPLDGYEALEAFLRPVFSCE